LKAPITFVAAIVAAASLGGCTSVPTTSGYLADYDRLNQGQHLDQYWADASIVQSREPLVILLSEVSGDEITDKKDVTVEDCVSWLRAGLENGGIISGTKDDAPVAMDVAITFMDPGSAAKRIWAGELGAGHAQVQVEGKVYDVESGQVLATFAERRSSSGAIGLKDLGGDAGPGLIEQMIKQIGDDVTHELRLTFAADNSDT
jgi:hypothetical protein